MKPLASAPREELARLEGLLFDLDDTLLSHGVLTRAAYDALWDLRAAGLRLVAVTGRPSGWGEIVVRQWPIDGAVTENGAIAVVREGRGIARRDPCGDAERRSRRIRLAQLVEAAREVVPEVRLADDVDARRSDVTWDIGERVTVPEDRVALLVATIAQAGARSTQSSVHVHATFDAADKAQGALALLRDLYGTDPGAARARYAFVGDSTNDAPCFAAFHTTFGVANVRAHAARLSVPPRYVAEAAMGEGFSEIARALLLAKPRG